MDAICTRCGAQLTEPECALCGGSAGDVSVPERRPPGRVDRRLAGGVVVAAVLALTIFLAVWLPGSARTASAPTAATSAPAGSDTAQTVATAVEVTYTCWDGTETTGLGDCGTPSGELGLRYVFPSLADDLDSCVLDSPLIARRPGTTSYRCEYPDGFILYRYWADGADAREHFETHYTGKPVKSDLVLDGQVAGFTYRGRLTNDDYTSTAALLNSHFTVSAASSLGIAERNALFATVTFRAVADVAGHPATEQPGVATRR